MRKLFLIALAGALPVLSGCNPLDGLLDEIRRSGHIPFQNPMAYSGTGTLVGGTPKRLVFVAPPEACFPEKMADGTPTGLRFRDDTNLPSRHRVVSVGFDANVGVLKGVSTANGTINAGVNFGYVQKMELSFEGVHIEYFDSIRLVGFYQNAMSSTCKTFLEKVAFIIQAIQAEKLKFKFYSKTGGGIKLSMENIKELLDISVDLSFEIVNEVELVITTPKYLGYQLGKLQAADNGFAFYRASRTRGNRFVFDPIGVFEPAGFLSFAPGGDTGEPAYPLNVRPRDEIRIR